MKLGNITKVEIHELGEHFALDSVVQININFCTLFTRSSFRFLVTAKAKSKAKFKNAQKKDYYSQDCSQ